MLNSNDSVLNQYAKLVKMLQAYRNNNLAEAVTYYEGFDPSLFTDETVVSIANGVKQDIETNGYQTLEDLAYTMWSAGRMAEALADYQTCLAIRPANPKVIFSMGMIYRAQGETDKAVEMFTQIVTQYADSEQADKARQQLAELARITSRLQFQVSPSSVRERLRRMKRQQAAERRRKRRSKYKYNTADN